MQLSWEQKDISFLGVNQLDLQGRQTYSICSLRLDPTPITATDL